MNSLHLCIYALACVQLCIYVVHLCIHAFIVCIYASGFQTPVHDSMAFVFYVSVIYFIYASMHLCTRICAIIHGCTHLCSQAPMHLCTFALMPLCIMHPCIYFVQLCLFSLFHVFFASSLCFHVFFMLFFYVFMSMTGSCFCMFGARVDIQCMQVGFFAENWT